MARPGPHDDPTTATATTAAAGAQRRRGGLRSAGGIMGRAWVGVATMLVAAVVLVLVMGAAATAAGSSSGSSRRLLQQQQQGRPSLLLARSSRQGQAGGESPLTLAAAASPPSPSAEAAEAAVARSPLVLGRHPRPRAASSWLSAVRGGVTKATSKSKVTPKAAAAAGAGNKIRFATEQTFKQKVKAWYRATPTITRLHLTLALVLTALGTIVIDPAYFVLDPVATIAGLQLWRPFTAAAFLGPPSMSWASNIYFLHQYGTALEQSEGAAQQLVFVLFNVAVLSVLGALLGLPVTSNALITAALHVLGRLDPMRDVQWMFSIKIKYWMLPFCLALVDMLQAQNPLAALPAALGILSGHLYYFLRNVWPKMGHRELLLAPEWWSRRLNKNNDAAIFGRDRRPPAAAGAGDAGGKGKKVKVKTKSYKFSSKK